MENIWKIWRTKEELELAIERNKKIGLLATQNHDSKLLSRCLERNQIMQQCLREKLKARIEG